MEYIWIHEDMRKGRSFLSLHGDTKVKHQKEVSVDNNKEDIALLGNEKDTAFVSLLKNCGRNKDLLGGSRIHDDILKQGLLEKKSYLISTLISMYTKCGAIEKAQEILEEMHVPDIVSWSALISGYIH